MIILVDIIIFEAKPVWACVIMPIIWRYLLGSYLKVLAFCVAAFVALLLSTRLEEIARFAALGAPLSYVLLFTAYQIPYIIPMAIPIAGLISSIILMQRMSTHHELTALRASGISIFHTILPILLAATILSLGNFYFVSELATHAHLTSRLFKQELKSINPLILLQNTKLMNLKGAFVQTLGHSKLGELIQDVVIAIPQDDEASRLNIIVAKELSSVTDSNLNQTLLKADHLSFLSSSSVLQSPDFKYLALENIRKSTISINDFSMLLKKESWRISNDHLNMRLLLLRLQEKNEALDQLKEIKLQNESNVIKKNQNIENEEENLNIKLLQKQVARSILEIFRRFSVGISVFTFTLMGLAFGMNVGRTPQKWGVLIVMALSALYLTSFFFAKGMNSIPLGISLYVGPHFIMIGLSILALKQISRGVKQ